MLTLLYWLSEELYQRLWRQAEGHFLVRLHEHMDWEPFTTAPVMPDGAARASATFRQR